MQSVTRQTGAAESPNLMDLILGHKIDVVIDTPPQGVEHQQRRFRDSSKCD